MDELVMIFDQFIARTWADPFEWGRNDCALWTASAVAHVTGFDPAKNLRGTYGTWFECRQVLQREGGLLPLVSKRMADFPNMSDEGVAVIKLEGRRICALVTGGRAIMKLNGGLRFADSFELIRGWTCPKP